MFILCCMKVIRQMDPKNNPSITSTPPDLALLKSQLNEKEKYIQQIEVHSMIVINWAQILLLAGELWQRAAVMNLMQGVDVKLRCPSLGVCELMKNSWSPVICFLMFASTMSVTQLETTVAWCHTPTTLEHSLIAHFRRNLISFATDCHRAVTRCTAMLPLS